MRCSWEKQEASSQQDSKENLYYMAACGCVWYEGVRISFDDDEVQGWMLIRMSLHDPVIPINLEAQAAGGTKIIEGRLESFFAEHDRLYR